MMKATFISGDSECIRQGEELDGVRIAVESRPEEGGVIEKFYDSFEDMLEEWDFKDYKIKRKED